MKRIFVLFFNVMSMNALAGYECDFQLAHTEDLYTTIATKMAHVDRRMKSGSEGTLFVESEKKKKKVSLEIRSVMDGYEGSESATFVVMRRFTKKNNTQQIGKISEIITLAGDDSGRLWFDNYKLDIQCRITK
jgi:hypothetical protein